MSLYNLKSAPGEWRITKFDNDLNVESSYLVSREACECPAGHRPSCRHRQMLPRMLAAQAEDSPMFYDFDNDRWLAPTGVPEILDAEPISNEQTCVPIFNPTNGIPKTSYSENSGGPDFDNATWFSTTQPIKANNTEASANLRQHSPHPQGTIRRRF